MYSRGNCDVSDKEWKNKNDPPLHPNALVKDFASIYICQKPIFSKFVNYKIKTKNMELYRPLLSGCSIGHNFCPSMLADGIWAKLKNQSKKSS